MGHQSGAACPVPQVSHPSVSPSVLIYPFILPNTTHPPNREFFSSYQGLSPCWVPGLFTFVELTVRGRVGHYINHTHTILD